MTSIMKLNNKNQHQFTTNKSQIMINKSQMANLDIYLKYIQKKVNLHEEIKRNYQIQIKTLEQRKMQLLQLVQQSINSNSPQRSINNYENKSLINNNKKSQIIQQSQTSKKNVKQEQKMQKSILFNKSNIQKQKVNYLTNINQYKYKDLIEQVTKLIKNLNALSKKTSSNNQLGLSNLYSKQKNSKQKIYNTRSYQDVQSIEFVQKYNQQIGLIQLLPTVNGSELQDQVLLTLIENLKKQQNQLINQLSCYKKSLIKKATKHNLEQKTAQNLRLIYKMKKNKEKKRQIKQVKSNKDIVRFGYTDEMLDLIRTKNIHKY